MPWKHSVPGKAEGLFLAVSIETGDQAEEADMAAAGAKLVQDYLDNRDSYLEAHRFDWKNLLGRFRRGSTQ